MGHSGSGFVRGTLRARVQVQGNSAHSTCLGEAGADGMGAGTEGNVREAMYGARAVGVHGMM